MDSRRHASYAFQQCVINVHLVTIILGNNFTVFWEHLLSIAKIMPRKTLKFSSDLFEIFLEPDSHVEEALEIRPWHIDFMYVLWEHHDFDVASSFSQSSCVL